jgi:hypothetical protein
VAREVIKEELVKVEPGGGRGIIVEIVRDVLRENVGDMSK